MGPVNPSEPIVERAVALGGAGPGQDRDGALVELIRLAGDEPAALHGARTILVGRIRGQSADHAATGGLTLVNAAIARLGWHGDYTWEPRS